MIPEHLPLLIPCRKTGREVIVDTYSWGELTFRCKYASSSGSCSVPSELRVDGKVTGNFEKCNILDQDVVQNIAVLNCPDARDGHAVVVKIDDSGSVIGTNCEDAVVNQGVIFCSAKDNVEELPPCRAGQLLGRPTAGK
jgi:hypothetical protein